MENGISGTNTKNSEKNWNSEIDITNNSNSKLHKTTNSMERMIPKRRILSLKEKGDIIEEVDRSPNVSKVKLAKKFNLATSTLATILANRNAILKTIAKCGVASSKRKNSRTSPYQFLEDKLLDWLIDRQEKGLPINSVIIREQAKIMAVNLGIEKFTASSGWIDRFKNRHGLGNKAVFDESVAKCKNRWASIRDTFPETTEPRKKHKSSEVTYTQSIYEADNGKLLGNPEAEKPPSNSIKLENSTWPADFADFPDQSSSDQGPSMNFPEIKVEVNNFGGEERTDGNDSIIENSNCGFGYIVPNSLYEVVTKTEPSLSKKRTCAESDEGTASAKSNKKGELSSSESESVAVAQPEYKPAEHPIETFFKSMAATVMTFPPHLMAIAKLNVCKLITELELRALTEKNPFVVSQDGVNELLSENIIDICSENSISVENGTRNEEG
ncbi:Major centromere autoantigen B like protein [Argiope bruennichi]|uniref:Major centromere autoantigen B like protein n=1 Tax=Argiope bruennichi TaxID=94029 RepID=A0A8T0EPY2_ARGBR|nr:Major centromere autoantigen B like protein [Argiope bruennichi]